MSDTIQRSKADEITKSCLASLEPGFRSKVRWWLDRMMAKGIIPYIYFGFRTFEKQKELYENYLAGKGGKARPPGSSLHEAGAAFDWVPIKPISADERETVCEVC